MTDQNLIPYYVVPAEGCRIAITVFRRCGCALMFTPEYPAHLCELAHENWHEEGK